MDVSQTTFPILDAITDTLHGRQLTSRRVASPIVTRSLVGANCRIVSASDIRCGRGAGVTGDARSRAGHCGDDVTVTSRGRVVGGAVKRYDATELDGVNNSSDDDDDDASDLCNDAEVMSMPWDMMSRWCRYAALSNLLTLWLVFTHVRRHRAYAEQLR